MTEDEFNKRLKALLDEAGARLVSASSGDYPSEWSDYIYVVGPGWVVNLDEETDVTAHFGEDDKYVQINDDGKAPRDQWRDLVLAAPAMQPE